MLILWLNYPALWWRSLLLTRGNETAILAEQLYFRLGVVSVAENVGAQKKQLKPACQ